MVKVVYKQCLKYSCPFQIKQQLIEIKRDITQKIEDLSNKIITSVEKQEQPVESCFRLGRYTKNKVRAIKNIFLT